MRGSKSVSLHHHAKAVPTVQRGIDQDIVDDIERQIEPLRLLGIDIEPQLGLFGEPAQLEQLGAQGRYANRSLSVFIARVQCRQLDRQAGG